MTIVKPLRLLAALALAASCLALPVVSPFSTASADTVWLVPESPTQLLVDEPNDRLYALGTHVSRLSLSTGNVLATSSVEYGLEIVQDKSSGALFVRGDSWIKKLNPTTLAVTATVDVDCPRSIAAAGGRLWYAWGCTDPGSLGSFDASATSPVPVPSALTFPQLWDVVAGSDDSVLFTVGGSTVSRIAISGATATVTHQATPLFSGYDLSTDPFTHVVYLRGANKVALDESDLHEVAIGFYTNGKVDASPSGEAMAVLDEQYQTVTITSRAGRALNRELPKARAIAWLEDGTLLVGGTSPAGTSTITLAPEAQIGRTQATFTSTAIATPDKPFKITGQIVVPRLAFVDEASTEGGLPLSLVRQDPGGDVEVATTTTASYGKFSFTTTATHRSGPATYVVRFGGTTLYRASATTFTVTVGGVPWDFNGDGYADLAVGAPGEDVGSIANAGSVTVTYGSATGPVTAGSQVWTQDSEGIPGTAETGDQFGYSLSSSDYNADGYADLAIGANTETLNGAKNAGEVTLLYGSRDGVTAAGAHTLEDLPKDAKRYVGESLASGDFNGDHYGDIAIGVPGYESVSYVLGSKDGSYRVHGFSESTASVPGTTVYGEQFGESLAVGDFNGDGYDDIAAGIPFDIDGRSYPSGAVVTVYGAASGLFGPGSEKWTLDSSGIVGTATKFTSKSFPDEFGLALAAGDVNGDGKDDLAIGAPGETVASIPDAGAVHVLLGTTSGISATNSRRIAQDTTGVPGTGERADLFGDALALGNDRSGGKATLAISSVGDQSVTLFPAGAVTGARALSQETTGIPDSTETGDLWGAFALFLDASGSGYDQLVIAAPGENSASGAITILPSSSGGVTATGATQLTQNSDGIAGSSESGDYWGWLNASR